MVIFALKLVNFRNHTHATFEFNDKLNVIYGDNGVGKTSILEAVHYLSLTKSFRTNRDDEVIENEKSYFQIFGKFCSVQDRKIGVNVNYEKGGAKKVFYNKKELKRKSDLIGKIPVVILSPGSQKVTEGAPSQRRNFLDRIISQIDQKYLSALQEYRRQITRRNTLLNTYKENRNYKYDRYFEALDEILVKSASYIHSERHKFIENYNPILGDVYNNISHIDRPVNIRLKSDISDENNRFKASFFRKLRSDFKSDVGLGRTTSGPHLEDVEIVFGDSEIKRMGSQGEHKVLLVSLKIAEGEYLQKFIDDPVIYLFDDMFALLDVKHCINILEKIHPQNQVLITVTDVPALENYRFDLEVPTVTAIRLPVEAMG